jgi:DNA invertase Pin-like site-specific DNA recombinase
VSKPETQPNSFPNSRAQEGRLQKDVRGSGVRRKPGLAPVPSAARLSRSLEDLLTILERIDTAGRKFRSLTEAIDTAGPAGRLMMQMLGSFAEFDRKMIRERTRARLARSANESASQSGNQNHGRATERNRRSRVVRAKISAQIARLFKVHRATVSRIVF